LLILRHPQWRTPFSPLVQLGLDLLCHGEVAEPLADKTDARGPSSYPFGARNSPTHQSGGIGSPRSRRRYFSAV